MLLHQPFQLLGADAELLRPIAQLEILVNVDPRRVLRCPLRLVVGHGPAPEVDLHSSTSADLRPIHRGSNYAMPAAYSGALRSNVSRSGSASLARPAMLWIVTLRKTMLSRFSSRSTRSTRLTC